MPGRPDKVTIADLEVCMVDAILLRNNGRTYVATYEKGRDEMIVAGELNVGDTYVAGLVQGVASLFRNWRS